MTKEYTERLIELAENLNNKMNEYYRNRDITSEESYFISEINYLAGYVQALKEIK